MLGIQHSEVGGQRGYRLTGNYARCSLFATTWQGANQAAQLLRSRRQRTLARAASISAKAAAPSAWC